MMSAARIDGEVVKLEVCLFSSPAVILFDLGAGSEQFSRCTVEIEKILHRGGVSTTRTRLLDTQHVEKVSTQSYSRIIDNVEPETKKQKQKFSRHIYLFFIS